MSDKKDFDASKALEEIKKDRNLTLVAGGAVAVVVGLFLPWYTITLNFLGSSAGSRSFSPGLGNGTGIFLLILSVVAVGAGLNILKQDVKNMNMLLVGVTVLSILIMLNNMPDSDLGGVVDTGIGYWLGLAGSVVMTAGAVMRFKSAKK
jgi:hypothetical protein